ncbi:single-stranded DNA-binding protein [Metapseudomonas otitidis]|uniref:single-stranded DNA-binding protein n=1 Tax=Metapseudomonas otitidis TaxID=319939 RepID=UPI0013F6991F|nr:single-stranded DNA-binding protein [Pseudomonas otitidis]
MSYSVNKVWLLGNAGGDAVSHPMGNGNIVVKVSLATRRGWMEESGWKEVTEWHNVSFFGKLAEKALKIKKGVVFSVCGRSQTFTKRMASSGTVLRLWSI